MTDPRLYVNSGQTLALAASQVNWINEQMRRTELPPAFPQFPGTPRLVIPCEVSTTAAGVKPGHVVKITGAGTKTSPDPDDAEDTRTVALSSMTGEVYQPVSLANYNQAKAPLGVIVGGVTMPTPSTPRLVVVCVSGLCVARVRGYAGSFIQGAVVRPGDTSTSLIGCAETCGCGHQRVVGDVGPVGLWSGGQYSSQEVRYQVVLL